MKIKSDGIKVGDEVEFDNSSIKKVFPRKSFFYRANVANVSCINVVISPVPKPDFLLVDKMIVEALSGKAKVYLTINKSDLDDGLIDYCKTNYANAVDSIIAVSALSGDGFDRLKSLLNGEFCAFVGQSAVGKTSIINRLFNIDKTVGDVSKKTMRGRHTTTGREIHFGENLQVVDTPGFSNVDVINVKSRDLCLYYKEFEPYNGKCYYIGCAHVSEPDCQVKAAVTRGEISVNRYERYKTLFKEIAENEKRKY